MTYSVFLQSGLSGIRVPAGARVISSPELYIDDPGLTEPYIPWARSFCSGILEAAA
jgi:hypothetical protein